VIGRLLRRRSFLSDREQDLRAREQELLERLARALEAFGPDVEAGDLQRFREATEQLAGLFLLVIAGEFNSGKSSFINALLGERVLPEGVTPTTDRINLLRHGPEITERPLEAYLLERTHPAELLRELNVVDTPCTNAVIRRHEELTSDFIPRADLVLFVTSADRPFSESEREFLEQIRQWGKKIVFIVNKIDILAGPAEQAEVIAYVSDNAAALLGDVPQVFPVSARRAVQARTEAALQSIDAQLALFHQDMLRDFEPRLSKLELLLGEMESRGQRFFEETIRLSRIRSLLDGEGIKRSFEREVVGDTPQQLEAEVGRLIDWIVERNLKVWQDVSQFVDRRRLSLHQEGMLGEVPTTFSYNRQALLESVGRVSREVIGGYDREREARAIADEVQGAFATTALAEAGAIGLGTLVATVVTGAAADVTGILLAAALAVGGFYVIPRKRRQAQADFRRRIEQLRSRLRDGLTRQVHHEVTQSTDRVNEAIAPYRRFVHSQQQRLNEARGELVATEDALLRLRGEIERR
jgi:GTP-binding protein EngB required for normal cell division